MLYPSVNTRVNLSPFGEWSRLRDQRTERIGSPFAGRAAALSSAGRGQSRTEGEWSPPVDIEALESSYRISVEVPGAKREDVSVEFHERVLTIKGKRERESSEDTTSFHHLERRFGSFERRFRLPEDARHDDIKAVYRDGVLSIEIPKIEPSVPTHVEIEA